MDNKILNNYLHKIESYLDEDEAINILKSIIQIDSRTNSKNENNIGYFKVEIEQVLTPKYFDDQKKLSCIISSMNLIKLLTVESQSNLNIFNLIEKYLNIFYDYLFNLYNVIPFLSSGCFLYRTHFFILKNDLY